MDLERGTRVFILDRKDYEVIEYKYIKKYIGDNGKTYHTLETTGGYREHILDSVFNHFDTGYKISKIVALSEMEEFLRTKLDKVHSQMRKHNIEFLEVGDIYSR